MNSTPAPDSELLVGSIAPPLRVEEFVKGEPVDRIEHGIVHVIEFWATWCGPCRESIPALTGLQARFPEVRVIGVAVWEDDGIDGVRAYVDEMGDAMGYRVAVDAPAPPDASGSPNDGVMVRTWLAPAYVQGIPYVMVVDTDGCIAWSGYPHDLAEDDIAAIVAGAFDRDEAAARQKEQMDRELVRETYALEAALQRLDPDDAAAAVAAYDEAFNACPELEWSQVGGVGKLVQLARLDDDAADRYADRLAAQAGDEPFGLLRLATYIAGLTGWGRPGPRLARKGLEILAAAKERGIRPAAAAAEIERDLGCPAEAMDAELEAVLLAAAGDTEHALLHAQRAYAIAASAGADEGTLAGFAATCDEIRPGSAPGGTRGADAPPPETVCEDGVCRIVRGAPPH